MICVLVQVGPTFLQSLRPPPGQGTDFAQDWISARNFICGEPVYVRLEKGLERHLGLRVAPGSLTIGYNAHPPTSVLLTVPFAVLDYYDATAAWNLFSLAAFAVSLWLVQRQLSIPFPAWAVLPLVTLLLVCAPLMYQLDQAQLNLFLLLLVTGAWAADRTGRPVWAGVLLGAAMTLKLFPGFLFLYFAARRQWRSLAVGAGTFILLTGLTVAVLGVETYRSYIRDVLPTLQKFQSHWHNHSLAGPWTMLFDPAVEDPGAEKAPTTNPASDAVAYNCVDPASVFVNRPLWRSHTTAVAGLAVCRALLVGTVLLITWWSRSREQLDIAFGLALTAMLLASPLAWIHYFLLLLLPWVLVWVRLPSATLARGLFMALTTILWINPTGLWKPWLTSTVQNFRYVWDVATPVHVLTILSVHCYALLGLFAYLLVLWRRAPAGETNV
jgi:alpha-1,2-mannosyltransferase